MGFECDLETLHSLVLNQSAIPRVRSFWFKFIHCFTRANVHYERFGIIDNNSCTWCDATPQTREHLYLHCPQVRSFFLDINNKQNFMSTMEEWLTGTLNRSCAWLVAESVYFIHASNYRRRELNRATFLAWLACNRDIELKIAVDNGRVEKFNKKWEAISNELGLPF